MIRSSFCSLNVYQLPSIAHGVADAIFFFRGLLPVFVFAFGHSRRFRFQTGQEVIFAVSRVLGCPRTQKLALFNNGKPVHFLPCANPTSNLRSDSPPSKVAFALEAIERPGQFP